MRSSWRRLSRQQNNNWLRLKILSNSLSKSKARMKLEFKRRNSKPIEWKLTHNQVTKGSKKLKTWLKQRRTSWSSPVFRLISLSKSKESFKISNENWQAVSKTLMVRTINTPRDFVNSTLNHLSSSSIAILSMVELEYFLRQKTWISMELH